VRRSGHRRWPAWKWGATDRRRRFLGERRLFEAEGRRGVMTGPCGDGGDGQRPCRAARRRVERIEAAGPRRAGASHTRGGDRIGRAGVDSGDRRGARPARPARPACAATTVTTRPARKPWSSFARRGRRHRRCHLCGRGAARWIVSAAASAGSSRARQVALAHASAGLPYRPPCGAPCSARRQMPRGGPGRRATTSRRPRWVDAAGAQRAPEAFHFSARGRVVRPRVDQRDAESLAAQAQRFAAVGAAVIIGKWRRGRRGDAARARSRSSMSASAQRGVLERDHEARCVVEHRVMRSGRVVLPIRRVGPWHTSPCHNAAGVIGLQRRRVWPSTTDPALEAGVAVQPRHGVSETHPAASRPSRPSVRRISGTDAVGCSRRISSRSSRCSGVRSRARPRLEPARGAARPSPWARYAYSHRSNVDTPK